MFRDIKPIEWIGLAANVITIVLLLLCLLSFYQELSSIILGILLWFSFVSTVVMFFVMQERHSKKIEFLSKQAALRSRRERFAKAQSNIHNSMHNLRDAWYSWLHSGLRDDIMNHLQRSIDSFASAISLISGHACDITLMELFFHDSMSTEDSFERGFYVTRICGSKDAPIMSPPHGYHWVDLNTDYKRLLESPEKINCFFSNNLIDLQYNVPYRSTHWPQENIDESGPPFLATMVFPVRKMVSSDAQDKVNAEVTAEGEEQTPVLGFLCVDSKARNAFNSAFDIELGLAYADVLYMMLKCIKLRSEGWKFSPPRE